MKELSPLEQKLKEIRQQVKQERLTKKKVLEQRRLEKQKQKELDQIKKIERRKIIAEKKQKLQQHFEKIFFENIIKKNEDREDRFFSLFDSVCGLRQSKKNYAVIPFVDAEKNGLQQCFTDSRLYWNKDNRALYILHGNNLYAITEEGI